MAPRGLSLNLGACLDPKGPTVEVMTLGSLRSRGGPFLAHPFSPPRPLTPHSGGLPAPADPRSGQVTWSLPPPSAPGSTQLGGVGLQAGLEEWRAGLGALEGSGRPSPAGSEVQEMGVSEASSWLDMLPVGLGSWGVRGLAPAAPSFLAGHQLGGLCGCRPQTW